MAHSHKFAIIRARPDKARGETVNVGIVISTATGLDVRLPELRKLLPLTGHQWAEVAAAYEQHLEKAEVNAVDLDVFQSSLNAYSDVFSMSRTGSLSFDGVMDYEAQVQSILDHYVTRPTLTRSQRQQKINSEITRMLKKAGVLGGRGATIEDHVVIPKFVISQEKDLVADFAYKNGALKVVATLDLRTAKSAHSKACEKGATLYFAKEKFGKKRVKPLAVFAVHPNEKHARRGEIDILTSFADGNAFNWLDANDLRKFKAALY